MARVSGVRADRMAVPSPPAAPLMPQFPHLRSRSDHGFWHKQKERGSDVIMYEMSSTQRLGTQKRVGETSVTVVITLIIFTNAAPFKWPNLFFYGWYLSGLILKNLEYQGLTNVL